MSRGLGLIMAVVCALATRSAAAEDIVVNITGEIITPPCVINNGAAIEVNFDNVSVTDVANARNLRTLTVPVTCIYYKATPYVKVTGTQLSGAGSHVLRTNITNFGIALYQGNGTGVPMKLNDNGLYPGFPLLAGLSAVNQASGQFTFSALPYQLGSQFPASGAFSATANMSITYQ
ncbi:minor pilin subunit PapF [Raoultella sp. BIGb0399]|nr:minor pilin subunit PapF [Raoultella sp. BIGb0399]